MNMKKCPILVSAIALGISIAVLSGCASTPQVLSDEEMWNKFVGSG